MHVFEVWKVVAATVQYETDLLTAYASECSNPAIGPLNPDWVAYARMEAAGYAQVFALYVGSHMAGFSCVLMADLPHYSAKVATVESLFLAEGYRGTHGFALLRDAVEAHAKTSGCVAILYSAPAGGTMEEVFDKRYPRTNSVYCKALTEQP